MLSGRPPARCPRRLAGIALLIATLAACGDEPQPLGPPSRIITIAPNISEILFDLGLSSSVVGVGDYASWPSEVESLPRLGGLFNARLETIVSLEPDLAILIPSERELGERLRRLGIDVLVVESDSLAQVEEAIISIAERCGVQEAGELAATRFRDGLERRRVASPAGVVVTIGREAGRLGSVMVAGPGSFVAELVERAGANNLFAAAAMPYPQVGAEELLGAAPTVIIELQSEPRSAAEVDRLLGDWRRLSGLPAVDTGCITVIDGGFTVLPGPRLPQLYERIVEALESCEQADV